MKWRAPSDSSSSTQVFSDCKGWYLKVKPLWYLKTSNKTCIESGGSRTQIWIWIESVKLKRRKGLQIPLSVKRLRGTTRTLLPLQTLVWAVPKMPGVSPLQTQTRSMRIQKMILTMREAKLNSQDARDSYSRSSSKSMTTLLVWLLNQSRSLYICRREALGDLNLEGSLGMAKNGK